MSPRWVGYCHGCRRDDREVETHYEHAARTLCDACAGRTPAAPRRPAAEPPTATPAVRRALARALDHAHLARAGRAAADGPLDRTDALVLGALHQFAFSKTICWPAQQTVADLIDKRREYVSR